MWNISQHLHINNLVAVVLQKPAWWTNTVRAADHHLQLHAVPTAVL